MRDEYSTVGSASFVSWKRTHPPSPRLLASYFHGVQCKIHLVDGVLSPWRKVCQGVGWTRRDETKRERERGWVAIGNPRSDQCHAAFIVLQQKGAHQSTGISSRLISRGRGETNLTLLSSPLLFLRPIISPFVPSSFFSLRPPHCIYVCVYPPLSFPPSSLSLGSSFVLLSPSLA